MKYSRIYFIERGVDREKKKKIRFENSFSQTNVFFAILGKFKDEGAGSPFVDGVFLRSKMYSILNQDDKMNKKTGKGIARRAIKLIDHSRYVACITDENYDVEKVTTTKFISENHHVYTVEQSKKGLSPYNDKVRIEKLPDGEFRTHSFGYNPIV